MARKRREIGESPETLRRLERRYQGKPLAARVRVLRLLKENPDLPIDEAAARVNYSVQGVKRWLQVYHESGIDALLGVPVRSQPPGQVERNFEVLKRKIASGEFTRVMDVACWIDSLSNVEGEGRVRHGSSNPEEGIPAFIVSALASLPTSPDPVQWTGQIKEALKRLLVDVDRISISVNTACNVVEPCSYDPSGCAVVSQSLTTGRKYVNDVPNDKGGDDAVHIKRFLGNMSPTFPFRRYHEPFIFVYYFGCNAFLGTLALWRERHRSVMAPRVIQMMERLRPFIVFLLSDFVARFRHANPERFVFDQAFGIVAHKLGFTDRERGIVILLMLGYSYEKAADILSISVNTFRHYVKSIHQKAGVKSHGELFAKYFSPRVDLDPSKRS